MEEGVLMYCKECGSKLPVESKFCQKCGVSQNREEVRQLIEPQMQQVVSQPQQNIQLVQPQKEPIISPHPQIQENTSLPHHDKKKSKVKKWLLIAGIIVGIGIIANVVESLMNSDGTIEQPQSTILSGATEQSQPTLETPNISSGTMLTPEQIFSYNADAVFMIFSTDGAQRLGRGSGFFICSTGIAVTNHHVIAGWLEAIAITEDGRIFNIVGYYSYDTDSDIAVIQVDGDGIAFQYVTIGDSDTLRIGQDVFTIGSPAGDHNTFFRSYISRHVSLLTIPSEFVTYEINDVLQITAPIVGGNSGGAMFNAMGEVVGVVTANIPMRPSIAFVVPISRLDTTNISHGQFSPLPLAFPTTAQNFFYASFPFVPTFGSVSLNAQFQGGIVLDGSFEGETLTNLFDYNFVYILSYNQFLDDMVAYRRLLEGNGFIFQGEHNAGTIRMIFFYHEMQNISLLLSYRYADDIVQVVIGKDNAFQQLFSDENIQNSPQELQTPQAPQRPSIFFSLARVFNTAILILGL